MRRSDPALLAPCIGHLEARLASRRCARSLKDTDGDFFFTAKQGSHTALFDFINGAKAFRHDEKIRKGKTTGAVR